MMMKENSNFINQMLLAVNEEGLPLQGDAVESALKREGFSVSNHRVMLPMDFIMHVLKQHAIMRSTQGQRVRKFGYALCAEYQKVDAETGKALFKLIDTSRCIDYVAGYPGIMNGRSLIEQTAFYLYHSQKPLVMLPECVSTPEELEEVFKLLKNFDSNQHVMVVVEVKEKLTEAMLKKFQLIEKYHHRAIVKITGEMDAYMAVIRLIAYYILTWVICPGQNAVISVPLYISRLKSFGQIADFFDRFGIGCRLESRPAASEGFDAFAGASFMEEARRGIIDSQADMAEFAFGALLGKPVLLEKFLVDEEALEMMLRLRQGVDCSEEKLVFNAIRNVGPRGNYFNIQMLKLFKQEFYDSRYVDKEPVGKYVAQERKTLRENIALSIKKRINSYVPPALTRNQKDLLAGYLKETDTQIIDF